ncbi:MAG: hypothetical protein K5854_01530 [Prevotella sp.]|nr:hypothetical protein [Prevotella sp.]
MVDKNRALRAMARRAGLCDEWFGEWHDDTSDADLIGKYKRGIDFSLSKDWLPNEKIAEFFDRDTLRANGVFLNDDAPITGNGTFVTLGETNNEAHFNNFAAAEIYARHNSHIKIKASDYAKITICLFDNAVVEVKAQDCAKIYIFKYGGKIKEISGNILVRECDFQKIFG